MIVADDRPDEQAHQIARQLRECTRAKNMFSLEDIISRVEVWRHDPGLDPADYINIGNSNGKTALHLAAQFHTAEAVQCFLDFRADVNCLSVRGHTPLIFACGRGKDDCVRTLLSAGARCRIRIANGETALSFGEGRLSSEVLNVLQQAEFDESGDWLDFTTSEKAIAAQADHVQQMQRDKYQSKKLIKITPAVADVLAKRQQASSFNGDESPEFSIAGEKSDPSATFSGFLCSRDSTSFAELLLKTAISSTRKRLVDSIREEILKAARHPASPDLHVTFLVLLRVASTALNQAARAHAGRDAQEKQHIKRAKIAATSALLSILKEFRTSLNIRVTILASEAPAWLSVELLSPPVGVCIVQDGAALEDIVRELCNSRAWGSDFGKALKWLEALRPQGRGTGQAMEDSFEDLQHAAFARIVSTYVETVSVACAGGRSLKKHMRDQDWLSDLKVVLGESALADLKQFVPKPRATSDQQGASIKVPEGVPVLELPSSASIIWVADENTWSMVEEEITHATVVAIDTEWCEVGTGPALVQIAVGSNLQDASCYLVDMLGHAKLAAAAGLDRLFSRTDVTILGWSFAEDRKRLLEVMDEAALNLSLGAQPSFPKLQVFDLQGPCAQELSVNSSPGLSLTCFGLLGNPLDKTEQCSDWGQRPLTDNQIRYAAMDAAVLLELHGELLRRNALH